MQRLLNSTKRFYSDPFASVDRMATEYNSSTSASKIKIGFKRRKKAYYHQLKNGVTILVFAYNNRGARRSIIDLLFSNLNKYKVAPAHVKYKNPHRIVPLDKYEKEGIVPIEVLLDNDFVFSCPFCKKLLSKKDVEEGTACVTELGHSDVFCEGDIYCNECLTKYQLK